MRKSNVLVLMIIITLAPATALAQSGPTPTASCTGQIAGTVGLAVFDSTGAMQTIAPSAVPYVFGTAECQCGTNDINLQIKLTTALPVGTVGTVEVWAGPSCDTYSQRTTGTPIPCQKIAVLDINDFTTSSTVGPGGVSVPIPSQALFSPNVTPAICTQAALANGLYLFIYTDPSAPTSTCTLQLTEENQGPTAASNIAAAPDTSGAPTAGVKVSWTPPAASASSPTGYALLCADGDGNPESVLTSPLPYSQCIDGKINRRALPGATTQTIGAKVTAPNGTIATLDPRFDCGLAGATTSSATLPLDPTKAHQVVVASIDAFGNVTGTAPVTSTASTTTGNDMGSGDTTGSGTSHGCTIGGAATSAPWPLAFVVLALGAIVVRGRRRWRM